MENDENSSIIEENEQNSEEIDEKEQNTTKNEDIDSESAINQSNNDLNNEKTQEKVIYLLGEYAKAVFYKKKKSNITFRLKKHQEYFISGKITNIIKSKEPDSYEFIIILELNNREKATYCSWEIDFETLTPSKYNPIRYFIRESVSEELKQQVFKRDNYECQLKLQDCDKKAEVCDHIIPVSKGGLSILDNLQASCIKCNRKKSSNLLF